MIFGWVNMKLCIIEIFFYSLKKRLKGDFVSDTDKV